MSVNQSRDASVLGGAQITQTTDLTRARGARLSQSSVFELAAGLDRRGTRSPFSGMTAIFGWMAKTNPPAQEPLSAGSICLLSNDGRTTTGRHHEEDSLGDGRCYRIRCTLLRG